MKKLILTPDKRALAMLKLCVYIVLFGILTSIIVYTSSPSLQTAYECRQCLLACAFGMDIAIGGYLYMDHKFRSLRKK